MQKYLYLTCFLCLLMACKNSEKTTGEPPQKDSTTKKIDLNGQWLVLSVHDGEALHELKNPSLLTLEGGKMSLQLKVNSCGGEYKLAGSTLTIPNTTFCTEKCCDRGADQVLKNNLNNTWTVVQPDANSMTWTAGKKVITLAKHQTAELEKQPWRAEEMVLKGKNPSTQKFSKNYILTFGLGSRILLKLDVNECNTGYRQGKGQSLIFDSPLGCTRACCDSDKAQQLGKQFSGTLTYKIEGDKLILGNDQVGLVFSRYYQE